MRRAMGLAFMVCAVGLVGCGDDDDDENEQSLAAFDQQLCSALEGSAREAEVAAAPSQQFVPGATLPALDVDATAYTLTLPMAEMGGTGFEGVVEIVVQTDGQYAVGVAGDATLTILPRGAGPAFPTETLTGSDSPCPSAISARSLFNFTAASAIGGVHYFVLESDTANVDISVFRVDP